MVFTTRPLAIAAAGGRGKVRFGMRGRHSKISALKVVAFLIFTGPAKRCNRSFAFHTRFWPGGRALRNLEPDA